jgi:SOS-response transcriptional repressor LexA
MLSMHHDYTKRIVCVNTLCVAPRASSYTMTSQHERLRLAREAAGFPTAAEAARAMHVNETAYYNHENGWRGLTRKAADYARFFNVSADWILTGRGDMTAAHKAALQIPVMGKVGAGAVVDMPFEVIGEQALDHLAVELDGDFALQVEGDSMYPRFMESEWLIVDGHPLNPRRLVGSYAVVQIEEQGNRLVKMLKNGTRPNLFTLWSHNAPEIVDARILTAWRIKCVWCR